MILIIILILIVVLYIYYLIKILSFISDSLNKYLKYFDECDPNIEEKYKPFQIH